MSEPLTNNAPAADEIFGPPGGPTSSVSSAVQAAKEIAKSSAGDEQAIADSIREVLLPILQRLPVTDRDVALRAVAKLLPVGVEALRHAIDDRHRTVMGLLKGTDPDLANDGKPSHADLLFALASERYVFIHGDDGEPYAIPRDGPQIARPLRGSGSLRAELAAAFVDQFGKVPSTTAIASALVAVEGNALGAGPTPVHLRHARLGSATWIDLGGQDGAAVVVRPEDWKVIDCGAPVIFRRTLLTAEMPRPDPDGDVGALRELLGPALDGDSWLLIIGWLVAALGADFPLPILFLVAEAGAAKTTLARMIVGTIDPSVCPTRSVPRDERDWITATSASLVVAIDNVGYIHPWLSDALCRAVTGEGFVRRRLYSDNDIAVTTFRRAVIVTGIDIGADRADLLDRCVPVELRRIPEDQRRPEAEVMAEFEEARPRILGGLLDLLSGVLQELPNATLDKLPRMADYASFLAALDLHTGWETLPAYLRATQEALASGAAADPVAVAVVALLDRVGTWRGTAGDLLTTLDDRFDDRPPKRWPTTPSLLSRRLRLAAPALRAAGYQVDDSARDRRKRRLWTFAAPDLGNDGNGGNGEIPTPLRDHQERKTDDDDLEGWEVL